MDPRYYRRAVDAVAEIRGHGDGIGNRIHIHLGNALSLKIDDTDIRGTQQSDSLNPIQKTQEIPQQAVEAIESDGDHENKRNPNAKKIILLSRLSLIEDATCVFLYLLPEGLEKVKPLLERCMMKKKTATANNNSHHNHPEYEGEGGEGGGIKNNIFRVVSYMFRIPNWKPVGMREHADGCCKIYLYDVTSISYLQNEGDSLSFSEGGI